ncbi:hypothetical protein ON010_g17941 [Phytophthora cinnamomi]|nr:hypothetical protein ON010_g17941 [Phytophthora cinnamomi]
MVDRMLRGLPTLPCYNELRRKALFSSDMGNYTPDLVRELVLTAELRSKDWENNAFGNKQTSESHAMQSGVQRSNQKNAASGEKKPNNSGGAYKGYFTTLQTMDDSDWNPTISGFADGVDAKAEGFGTIMLAAIIDEEMAFVLVKDVLHVPRAGCNLFSPGLALDQEFAMTWDSEARILGMTKENTEVIRTEI